MKKQILVNLQNVGAIALKAGTEFEKQTPEEISWMKHITHNHFNIRTKISGAEDCANLKALIRMGFTDFIAPLIETSFAVKKFIMAVKWATEGQTQKVKLDLNIESITAYNNILDILECYESKYIRKINIGKSDLSLSMGMKPDDKEVLIKTAKMIELAKEHGKLTGVGGSINTKTIVKVLEETNPDEVETRNVILYVNKMKDPVKSIRTALEFEKELVKEEMQYSQFLLRDFNKRISGLNDRISE